MEETVGYERTHGTFGYKHTCRIFLCIWVELVSSAYKGKGAVISDSVEIVSNMVLKNIVMYVRNIQAYLHTVFPNIQRREKQRLIVENDIRTVPALTVSRKETLITALPELMRIIRGIISQNLYVRPAER